MNYSISEEAFNKIWNAKETKRDESKQWPNSFGHGFCSGQMELLMELKDYFNNAE